MVFNGKYDLEERLIDFAVIIMKIAEKLHKSFLGYNLANQLIRSGTSPALNYGEVQGSASRKDFVHKMRVCLKELRETSIALKIAQRLKFKNLDEEIEKALKECNELIAIFTKSIKTAENK